jgi:IMP dehydrogenase
MNMNLDESLSFDDVLLVPQKTSIRSRSDLNTKVKFLGLDLETPIISANMSSVTGPDMLRVMQGHGLGILHRMNTIKDIETIDGLTMLNSGISFGIGEDWIDRVEQAKKLSVKVCCLDVAHAHSDRVGEVIKAYWEICQIPLIVGNIATPRALEFISLCTPKQHHNKLAVKVGIGGGSLCTTRIQTGFGIPTLQSVYDVSYCRNVKYPEIQIVADGGIKNSGDIVKSIAAGADVVMIGSLLAGTDQAPGEVILSNSGSKYKIYRGSASFGDKQKRGEQTRNIEGTESLVPYKGDAVKVLKSLKDGILSGLSYSGYNSLRELRDADKRTLFTQITNSGYRESLPHGVL